MTGMRWRLADEDGGQGTLFEQEIEHHVGRGEFRGMEFLHVEARRVINEVPKASRMPFRWTINAYRGCSHACSYCLEGSTPILTANGRTEALADLGVGDLVYGTTVVGGRRRLTATTVLDHWSTVKPAYRVALADGTDLIASGDHRFLTQGGWRFVVGGDPAWGHRPRLVPGDRLLGTAPFAAGPTPDDEYRRGYLSATTRPQPVRAGAKRFLAGGLPEHLRFFHSVDSTRDVAGTAVEAPPRLTVVAVEPVGVMRLFDITTGTGDFIAQGVVSHNCFARPTHEYLGMNSGEDFDRRIVVKINAVERVRAELAPGRWAGDHIAMGTNTDPYQRCEGKYRLTQGIVAELSAAANPFSILTKSTLILRDLDLLAEAARRTEVRANLSIGTLDENVWRMSEPGTPHPLRRVEAVARLNEAGVACGVLVAPVLPGLSDSPEQLEAVVKACVDAGARSVTPLLLHLRPGVREHYLAWLAGARRDLLERYTSLYPRSYAPAKAQDELATLVKRLVARHGGQSVGPLESRSVPPKPAPSPPAASQLELGV